MTSDEESSRTSRVAGLLAFLFFVLSGLGAGWVFFRFMGSNSALDAPAEPSVTRIFESSEAPRIVRSLNRPSSNAGTSSLEYVRTGAQGESGRGFSQAGGNGGGTAANAFGPRGAASNGGLVDIFRREWPKYIALGNRYEAKYAVIRQFEGEWLNSPDLAGYTKDFYSDYNVLKFAWNVGNSPNFGRLLARYATRPEILGIVKDSVATASPELLHSVQDYFRMEKNGAQLLKKFGGMIGVPDYMMSLVLQDKPPNEAEIKASLLKNNPGLGDVLRQNNIDLNQLNQNVSERK